MHFDSMLRRGIWMSLFAAAAVVVVILSWRVPDPQQRPESGQPIERIAYTSCGEPQPPNYGTRALDTLDSGCGN